MSLVPVVQDDTNVSTIPTSNWTPVGLLLFVSTNPANIDRQIFMQGARRAKDI
jgi:hypothetical protein